MTTKRMTSTEVYRALERRYHFTFTGESVLLREVRLAPGHQYGRKAKMLDALAVRCWEKRHLIGFEIKISRSDFLKEMRDPKKREPGVDYTNRFYFVTPFDMVDVKEIPPECGLIYVSNDTIRIKKNAPWTACDMDSNIDFVASIMRNLARVNDGLEKDFNHLREKEQKRLNPDQLEMFG